MDHLGIPPGQQPTSIETRPGRSEPSDGCGSGSYPETVEGSGVLSTSHALTDLVGAVEDIRAGRPVLTVIGLAHQAGWQLGEPALDGSPRS